MRPCRRYAASPLAGSVGCMNNSDQGLGLSVAIYAVALVCGLALFVMPVVWANGPRVYDNPGVGASRMPGGPAYAHRSGFPLAKLQEQQIVSPAMLAELNAKVKKEKPAARKLAKSGSKTAKATTVKSRATTNSETTAAAPAPNPETDQSQRGLFAS